MFLPNVLRPQADYFANPAVHTDFARKAAQAPQLHVEAVEKPKFHRGWNVKTAQDVLRHLHFCWVDFPKRRPASADFWPGRHNPPWNA